MIMISKRIAVVFHRLILLSDDPASYFYNFLFICISDAPIVTGLNDNNETIMSSLSPSSLVCSAQSHPVSTITWYKNGVELVDNAVNNFDITESVELNTLFDNVLVSKLTFNSLSKTDSDHYKCKASNRLGEDSQTTHLIVHCKSIEKTPLLYLSLI